MGFVIKLEVEKLMQLLIERDNNDGRPTFVLSVFHKKFQMIKVALQKVPLQFLVLEDYFQKLCAFSSFL